MKGQTNRVLVASFVAGLTVIAVTAALLIPRDRTPARANTVKLKTVVQGSGVINTGSFELIAGRRGQAVEGRLEFRPNAGPILNSFEIFELNQEGSKVDLVGRATQGGAEKYFCAGVEDNGTSAGQDVFRIAIAPASTTSCENAQGGPLEDGQIKVTPQASAAGTPTHTFPSPRARASRAIPPVVAGAAVANITPFTLTPELTTCRNTPSCTYYDVLQKSNPAVSNPDGMLGGLFDQVGEEMAPGVSSDEWIGPTGVWGEEYTDQDLDGEWDIDGPEPFTDDPANSSALVDTGLPTSPLGDPAPGTGGSTGKRDGINIAGYGYRPALGAFDPLTARALYIRDDRTGKSIAWVTLDLTGYFSDFIPRIRAHLEEGLDVDEIILTHTHNHEGPDVHVGIWGPEIAIDGTYPRYEIYIERKIAQAINQAVANAYPARFRFGSIRPNENFLTSGGITENLQEMMSRNSCRTPWFFDDELRVMQILAETGAPRTTDLPTIATLTNWGAHMESMDGRNRYLSGDFANGERTLIEQRLGGVAIHTPSAMGASEIIGDSCTRRWNRDTFDGQLFPVDSGGDPIAFHDPYNNTDARDRTYAIGRVVGAGALAALKGEPLDPTKVQFEVIGPQLLCFPVNNQGLAALGLAGVIDKPFLNPTCTGPAAPGPPTTIEAGLPLPESPPNRAKTNLYALRIGSGSFVTAPGELQPELYYGVSTYNRSAPFGDYESVNPDALACAARSHHTGTPPGAHSDRPYEPAIRPVQIAKWGAKVNFLIGYSPDLLGYIVPGYDFHWVAAGGGIGGVAAVEAADPCRDHAPDLAYPLARYTSHYQETNSAGSMLAPAVTCEVLRLLGTNVDGEEACMEWDSVKTTGHFPTEPGPAGYEPDCPPTGEPADNEGCVVRHY